MLIGGYWRWAPACLLVLPIWAAACGEGAIADDDNADMDAATIADASGDSDAIPSPDAAPLDGQAPAPDANGDELPWLAGVNLSGAEFGEGNLPGEYGVNYIYPDSSEVDYFLAKGMNVFRVAFRWERLQRSLNGELDSEELARLDALVGYITAAGAYAILDPHNYARYDGSVVGSEAVPRSAYADFWERLALLYADDARVVFGLMNEPHDMATEDWLAAANDAIAAIRAAGAANLILVPGNAYTGAHSWFSNWYGSSNASVMVGVVDPGDNFAFEVHQYLDSDSSGTSETCVSETIGSERVSAFTDWLHTQGYRAFLGEFAGARNDTCYASIDNLLDHLDANRDVWIGWTWWAAGPWWGDYMFTLSPDGATDRPQMAILVDHL